MLKAQAQVKTPKAARYLKALCNHFSRKVDARYDERRGMVQFGFGMCEMDASESTLTLRIQAEGDENLARIQAVVADHLQRFSPDEALQIEWLDQM